MIIGDAAHALVPFYGQGMNAGFEDVHTFISAFAVATAPCTFCDSRVLASPCANRLLFFPICTEVLQSCGNDISRAVPEWARARKPRGDAIAELSFKNYVEMRSHTAKKSFLLRKRLEAQLHSWFPSWWIPLYSMVAFTSIPYDECIAREKKQSAIISTTVTISKLLLLGGVVAAGFFGYRKWCPRGRV